MSALSPDDHRKLVGILARLGSSADGERAAAGLLATRLLERHKLRWEDVIPARLPAPATGAWQGADYYTERSNHVADAARCLNSGMAWKAHERKFLEQIRQQRREPTEKQRAWLDGLIDRVTRREAEVDW